MTVPPEVFLAVVGIVVGGAVARRLRLVPRARWVCRRLWCSAVGHDWELVGVDCGPDRFNQAGVCQRCGRPEKELRRWREVEQ